jgi:hypothetical protein
MISQKLSMIALCGGLVSGVQAEVLYSTGFEEQAFSLGTIDGQDGWYNTDGSSSVIQNSVVHSGSQAAAITGFGESTRDTNVAVAGKVFSLQCDYMFTGNPYNQSGIFLWGDTGFIAQLVGTSTGANNSASSSSRYFLGGYATSTYGQGVDLVDGQWHHLNLILDIPAQIITGYADGNYLGSLAIDVAPFPTAITGFGFYQYQQDSEQVSYFDNFSFEAVPAPGAGMLLGLAGMVVARRRR